MSPDAGAGRGTRTAGGTPAETRTPDHTPTAAGPVTGPVTGLAAVRGAVAVDADTAPAIARATHELLAALLAANRLERADLVSLVFTQTPDLTATNPALALHEAGWDLPALCAQDAAFAGAPARTLRVLAHLRWDRPGRPVPAYLAGAAPTRPGA
ncbi:chorismate mutase [Streptomyces sp. CC208A]|uniref:chorismate mutase n=1 Tax=Streptomyces sp. CC208A TaxID=3044573 RepID=UPI0024A848D9|nr:chorismate mutase [Streptomyces sp. CC208A]